MIKTDRVSAAKLPSHRVRQHDFVHRKQSCCSILLLFLGTCLILLPVFSQTAWSYSFLGADLFGAAPTNPTSIQFGPDGRLYVAQQNGIINIYTITRLGPGSYEATSTETVDLIYTMQNHNDDGSPTTISGRQVTGILVVGTAENPVLYVTSSDPRIGAGGSGTDTNLDTNSGTISRLVWNGSSWAKVDLVSGLPRSEENHSANGMQLDSATNILYVAQGGNTNAGAPSNNFALLTEYALAAAILAVDLNIIDDMPDQFDPQNGSIYKYRLPTLDDPDRTNLPDGSDPGDPFGGNDGLNQAKLVEDGPVSIYASGFRNAYDLVITTTPGMEGRMYTVDNGANSGWGGYPEGEGPIGLCSNDYVGGEPGFVNNRDGLHYIDQPGYYGGHPTPIRGNPAGAGLFRHDNSIGQSFFELDPTVDWPPVPLSIANPIECDYQQPGVDDPSLVTFTTSTNGLAEYTASNFNGELRGSLLAAAFNGNIFRIVLNQNGTVSNTEVLASNFGPLPLDVTAQGDEQIFPGTIWVAVYAGNTITVFEPTDYDGEGGNVCSGIYDWGVDEDNDGYSNADEIDNGADPCSAADRPPDYDNDFLSDLNDSDDDNDGIPDTEDLFQRDAYNGTTTTIPLFRSFFNNDPGFGFFGIGFTGIMANGLDYLEFYDPENIVAGGAAGLFTIGPVDHGTAMGALNSQSNGFQFGINVDASTPPFTISTRIPAPFFNGATPVNDQSQGLYIGNGDQDNYLKIALNANDGFGGILVLAESDGVVATTVQFSPQNLLSATSIDLHLTIYPGAGMVQPSYTINMGTAVELGTQIAIAGQTLVALQTEQALAVGLMANAYPSAPAFTATWEFINVGFLPGSGEAHLLITPSGTIDASSYGTGSFRLENRSIQGENITRVSIDLRTAILPDLVFDPHGSAGDTVAKDFTVDFDPGVGLVGYTLLEAYNGINGEDGYQVLEILFNDFDPGEVFTFSIDVDPLSIKGSPAPGPGESGSISGLEMTGASVIAEFSDAATYSTQLFRIPDSLSGSENLIRSPAPPRPEISLMGISQNPVTVNQAQQTVRVSGEIGSNITLLVWEAALFTEGLPGGGYQIDPYEANSIIAVHEFSNTIGSSGYVDIPIYLTRSNPAGGIHSIVAVQRDSSGMTGPLSTTLVVAYEPPAVELAAYPSSLHFGRHAVGASSSGSILLNNTGTANLLVSELIFHGDVGTAFSTDLNTPVLLSGGSQVAVNLVFSPMTPGHHAATLSISHSGDNADLSISLSGEGVAATEATHRINAGGGTLSSGGFLWSADHSFAGSSQTFSSAISIDNTTNDVLYQSERNGDSFSYALPVTNGFYTVHLHFAEIWWGAPGGSAGGSGQRLFNVDIENGQGLLGNYDIFAEVGAATAAVVRFDDILVTDNVLDIVFNAVINNAKISAIEVTATGSVSSSAILTTDTDTVNFGDQELGGSSAQTILLGNSGTNDVEISALHFSGAAGAEFSADLSLPLTVSPGAAIPLQLVFSPLSPSSRNALLTILHSGENEAVTVNLSGTGVSANHAVLVTDTISLTFGEVAVGTTVTRNVVLSNGGSESLTITGFTLSGRDAAEFGTHIATPLHLSPGLTVTAAITFTPRSATRKTATLTVFHNGINQPITISLTAGHDAGGSGTSHLPAIMLLLKNR